MNYKIKVENNIDELVGLFGQLGCKYFNHTGSQRNYMLIEEGKAFFCKLKKNFTAHKSKEITLPQLRDLVVLKRNDVWDATHIDRYGDKWLCASGIWCFYTGENKWDGSLSGLMNRYELKPIEKEMETKEFLNSKAGYVLQVLPENAGDNADSGLIEVPEGSIALTIANGTLLFWNEDSLCLVPKIETSFRESASRGFSGYCKKLKCAKVLWQRETLIDKVASAEVACQELIKGLSGLKFEVGVDPISAEFFPNEKHSHYKKDVSHLEYIDVYRVLDLFAVENPCLQHAIKKLLCAGQSGSKGRDQDVKEAIDTLIRFQEMRKEDGV